MFDVHLHYNVGDAAHFTPDTIVAQLQANHVRVAMVTSRPPEQVLQLRVQAPELILPMLGVYRSAADKATWMDDAGLPDRVEQALAEGPWRAVGELHLFAEDRRSAVFLRIAELATSRGLPLQLHCDPAVIDTLFEQVPESATGSINCLTRCQARSRTEMRYDYLGKASTTDRCGDGAGNWHCRFGRDVDPYDETRASCSVLALSQEL